MSEKNLGVKVRFGSQCRRFRIPEDLKLSAFTSKLESFFLTKLNNFNSRYQDEDGDWVNIDTEEEFTEAKLLTLNSKENILKLEIVQKNNQDENNKKTDLEKFVLKSIEETGTLVDSKKIQKLYNDVSQSVKGKQAKEQLSKFVQEVGSLLTELSLSFTNDGKETEISKNLKKEFTVDINSKSGKVDVYEGPPKTIQKFDMKPNVLGATFIEDVTLTSSKNSVEQGTTFNKIWRVKNTGNCNWENVNLQYVGGSDVFIIPKDSKFKVEKLAKVNEVVEVSVELNAPQKTGKFCAFFEFISEGKAFGEKLKMEVVVIENPLKSKWAEQLVLLSEMGFDDTEKLIETLEKNGGDVPKTIQEHLSR